jgi:hypothetical protein
MNKSYILFDYFFLVKISDLEWGAWLRAGGVASAVKVGTARNDPDSEIWILNTETYMYLIPPVRLYLVISVADPDPVPF